MPSLIERLRSLRHHGARLDIEAESAASLSLRSDRGLVVFDRLSRAVTQNGRQIATFGSIHSVRFDAEANGDKATSWLVVLQLAGSRAVAIGRTSDESEAAVAAERIAAITGTRVVAKRAS